MRACARSIRNSSVVVSCESASAPAEPVRRTNFEQPAFCGGWRPVGATARDGRPPDEHTRQRATCLLLTHPSHHHRAELPQRASEKAAAIIVEQAETLTGKWPGEKRNMYTVKMYIYIQLICVSRAFVLSMSVLDVWRFNERSDNAKRKIRELDSRQHSICPVSHATCAPTHRAHRRNQSGYDSN